MHRDVSLTREAGTGLIDAADPAVALMNDPDVRAAFDSDDSDLLVDALSRKLDALDAGTSDQEEPDPEERDRDAWNATPDGEKARLLTTLASHLDVIAQVHRGQGSTARAEASAQEAAEARRAARSYDRPVEPVRVVARCSLVARSSLPVRRPSGTRRSRRSRVTRAGPSRQPDDPDLDPVARASGRLGVVTRRRTKPALADAVRPRVLTSEQTPEAAA